MTQIKTYGPHDEATYNQILRCTEHDGFAVLCADNHLGYSQPIGGGVAYRDWISPSGVGYDIGCGNKAVLTDLHYADIQDDVPKLMDEIARRISFGMGKSAVSRIEGHAVLDRIREADFAALREMYDLAAKQLGTVGAGNHYVDLFTDDDGRIWVGVHFGSRGFGYKTAEGFLALAHDLEWGEHLDLPMDAPPTLLDINTDLGQAYLYGMELAGEYAYAGRDAVVEEVLDILTALPEYEVHNHHNYAWRETHFGEDFWVVRKGCTPAWPGQEGFVGGSMGDLSVILVGNDTPENAEGLYSTIHGAGRAMSRTKAAGKFRRRKMYACQHSAGCGRLFSIDGISPHNAVPKSGVCPDHPKARVKKVWIKEQKSKGVIDWEATQADLRSRGIELRGGAADEAPGAYKRLPEVLKAHGDTITVKHVLQPIGVVMAGDDVWDAYKD